MKKLILLFICLMSINSINLFAQKGKDGMHMHRRNKNLAYNAPVTKIINMSYLSYIVNTSVEVGVFDVLSEKSLTVKEIAKELKTQERPTDALLIVLDAAGLLEFNHGKYSLSPAAKSLISSTKNNQIDRLNKNTVAVTGQMENLKAALTGELKKTPSHHGKGSSWSQKEFLVARKEHIKKGDGQTIFSFIESLPEFGNCRKMIDFAGSIGYYTFPLLDKNPELKAYVYDLPNVCEIGREVQKDEKNFDRVTFCGFNMRNNDPIGNGYDLFFVSNALYGQRTKEELVALFKQANKSMKTGGVLVSNHWTNQRSNNEYLSFTISTLLQSLGGRPVHFIPEDILKEALTEAGFDNFTEKRTGGNIANPMLLLAARKIRDL